MSKYRIAVTCPVCDELIIGDGYHVDFTTPDSPIPIVALNSFTMQTFECGRCNTEVRTADSESMYEYEERETDCEEEAEDECDG